MIAQVGFLVDRSSVVESDTHALDGSIDRIGAGDAYVAGVLYGLTQELVPQALAIGLPIEVAAG
jgi:sugar/nucleoside kinase (ribokinase family)